MEERRVRKYVLRGLLGEGSQGATFDALDSEVGTAVAVKRFDVRGARSWKDVELAERETRVLATIAHPLLPKYIDHFEEDGALYLVMEKVKGETLESIRTRGAFDENEARAFLACATEALAYLHGRHPPIVHRDIKPRNVIRRSDGKYVLVDFGAVSEHMKPRGGSTVVGTVGYMAPEQLQGRSLPETDVYAVGATLLAGLTGMDPDQLPHRGLRIDVRAALGKRVSEDLLTTLERMTQPDPDERAWNARAVAPAPLLALAPAPPRDKKGRTPEDNQVRSITGLLWALWALGWPTLMPIFNQPAVMFVWMGLILILTWHKGAIIRAGLRQLARERASLAPSAPTVRVAEPVLRTRIDAPERPAEPVEDVLAEEEARRRSSIR